MMFYKRRFKRENKKQWKLSFREVQRLNKIEKEMKKIVFVVGIRE